MEKKKIVRGMKSKRDPRAFHEFCDQHDAGRDAGDEGAEAVDERALQPMRAAILPPVHDHAGLREREGEKRADGIERDQAVRDATEKNKNAAT